MSLKTLRESAGKTQREAAEAAGLSLRGYQYLETKKDPKLTLGRVRRLSKFFGVDVSELFI